MDSNGNHALVPTQGPVALAPLRTIDELAKLGELLARSGFFKDGASAAQCVVKCLVGAEFGFSPLASMTGVHIIEGKPSIGSHLVAAAIRRSGRYDFKLLEHTDQVCTVRFLRRRADGSWEDCEPVERCTLQEAVEKGWTVNKDGKTPKLPWLKTPKNMLFARCLTNGYKFHCPDLMGGMLTYDPDELAVEVQPRDLGPAHFNVLDAAAGKPAWSHPQTDPEPPAPEPQPAPPAEDPLVTEDQANQLAALTRDAAAHLPEAQRDAKIREVAQALLARYVVRGYARLPSMHFDDACAWLKQQGPRAMPEPPKTVAPAAALKPAATDIDRVAKLVDELGLSWTAFRERLQERYQQTSLAHVTLAQLREIEEGLRKSKAVRSAPAPASKGGELAGSPKS